jgi:hypothetical protein
MSTRRRRGIRNARPDCWDASVRTALATPHSCVNESLTSVQIASTASR